MTDGEAQQVPQSLEKFLAAATQEDFVELSSQIRNLIDNVGRGQCPSCGAPGYVYRNDEKHFAFTPGCPVARFRPMVRRLLPQSRR